MKSTIQLLAAAVTITTASAATVSYNTSFGPTAIGALPFNVSLTQFDPSLGTLQSVTLRLDAGSSGSSAYFENATASSGTVTLSVETSVTATSTFLNALVATPTLTGSTTLAASDGVSNSGLDYFAISGPANSDFDQNTTSTPANLALVTGLGTFSVGVDNDVNTTTSTSGIFGPNEASPGDFSGTVTVTYNYIPEPSSALLCGLAGFGMMLRRRR